MSDFVFKINYKGDSHLILIESVLKHFHMYKA